MKSIPGSIRRVLVSMNVWLPRAKYPDNAAALRFFDRMIERLGALPGAEAAALTSVLPVSGNFDTRTIQVEGQPILPGENAGGRIITWSRPVICAPCRSSFCGDEI